MRKARCIQHSEIYIGTFTFIGGLITLLWLALASTGRCQSDPQSTPATTAAVDDSENFLRTKALAEQGNAEAQGFLGYFYAKGKGVPQDWAEAIKWYLKAAAQGDIKAEGQLAHCYIQGEGVPKDQNEAAKWIRKAANQGDPTAECDLGYLFAKAENYVESAKWLRKAAEQGLAHAQYDLGSCYVRGDGVPRDYVAAYMWTNLSAAQGDESAKTGLPFIEEKMTPDQIGDAQRLSREFVPHKEQP